MHKKVINILVFIFIITFSNNVFAEDRYQWLHSTDTVTLSFDTRTIKFTNNSDGSINTSQIDVWLKQVYNEQGIKDLVEFRKSKGVPFEDFENLSHVLQHFILDSKSNKIAYVEDIAYDKDGAIIGQYSPRYISWASIIPGSMAEYWLSIFKSYMTNNWDVVYNRSKN